MKTAYDDCTYFSNTQKGIPQVANGKTDLLLMLDACLINGFNENMGIARVVGDDTVIEFGVVHGYLTKSMVSVVKNDIVKNYRIYQSESHSITIKDVKLTGDVVVKVASLGFTSLFDTNHKTQRVYRGRGGSGRVLHLNSEPIDGMVLDKANPAVLLRANMGDDMKILGEMINPLSPTDTIFFEQKNSGYVNMAVDNNPVSFVLVGNAKFFYLFIKQPNTYASMFGFGDFLAFDNFDSAFLIGTSDDSKQFGVYTRLRQGSYVGGGGTIFSNGERYSISLGLGGLSSGNVGYSYPNTGNLFFALPLRVDNTNQSIGFLPNLLFVNHAMSKSHHLHLADDVLLIAVRNGNGEGGGLGHFGFYLGDV